MPSNRPGITLLVGLSMIVLGTWIFLIPAIHDMGDLRHGEPAVAMLREDPTDCIGGCKLTFEADGRSITAHLAASVLIKKYHKGDMLSVRFDPGRPKHIALESDVGWGPLLFSSIIPLLGLLLVITCLVGRRKSRGA